MSPPIFHDVEQGSDAWHELRRGILTASEVSKILTPKTLKHASNDDQRKHVDEIAAQKITNFVEQTYVSEDMLRGHFDERIAARIYKDEIDPSAAKVGFVTNDKWGFEIGCSPDLICAEKKRGVEFKSRRQKYHLRAAINGAKGEIPSEHILQVQTCMLVCEFDEWDYVSYCAGMALVVIKVQADKVIHEAIVAAASEFYKSVFNAEADYRAATSGAIMTLREDQFDFGG